MKELQISGTLSIPLTEIELSAIRSGGAGGQHVNKVATGIHLRFAIEPSSLPEEIKQRLRQSPDRRISQDGIIIIKAQQQRSQLRNRLAALEELRELLLAALQTQKKRRPTKPSKGSIKQRLEKKKARSDVKKLRQRINH